MADPADIVNRYATITAALRARLLSFVQRSWTGLGQYRDVDVNRFVTAVVPIVVGAQLQMSAITDAYLAQLEQSILGEPARPVGVPADAVINLRGVDTAEVYRRAGVTTWTALSTGVAFPDAVDQGLQRATSLAATDLQMAKTASSRYVLQRRPGVVGYRRALTGSHSCGLCVVASTQRYHRDDLLPIHPGCDCAVRPIYGDNDPGHVIDDQVLQQAHQSIADRFGAAGADARTAVDYRHALIVHEHGEIGPVLAVRGQQFTGPGDL